jgi:hypothetical protein
MSHVKTVVVVVCLFLVTSVFAAGIEKNIEKSFNVGKGGTLELNSEMGSVDITSHAENKVLINVSLTAMSSNANKAEDIFKTFELTFNRNGNDVRIEGDMLNHRQWWNNRLKVHFKVIVPQNYNLKIATSGGNIEAADIKGRVILKTSGGGIIMGRVDGEVNAKTSGGGIALKQSTGNASLRTSGGSIRIGEVDGDVNANTSGGNIDVDIVRGNLKAATSGGGLHFRNVHGNLVGKTSGGSIVAELSAQVSEPAELYTSGGNITLTVPPGFKANLAASTLGGHVYTDLPVMVQGKISSSSLNGLMNGGGPHVNLKTTGGNIDIVKNLD